MGTNKKYFWLKLQAGFFTQREIKKLRKIAGGDTYTIIYLKLQLLSIKNEGILFFEGLEETFIEEMALEIDEEVENVRFTIMFLQKYGLMEEMAESEYMLPEAAKNIGSETQGAERVRKYREDKKALQSNTDVTNGNALVTKCNTEKEIEIELDKEIDKENRTKRKKPNGFEELINSYTSNPNLKNAIVEFIKMRKKNKKDMTVHAVDLMLGKLDKMAANDDTKVSIINQSLENCWSGLYEIKNDISKNQNSNYKTNMQKAYENINWNELDG